MWVVYTFCALSGALFAAASWLRLGEEAKSDGESRSSVADRRLWALPLCAFGLVGVTLVLLERPFLSTLLLSLFVGPPLGLLASWVGRRVGGG